MRLRKVLRAVSWLVLTTFTSLCIHPAVAALQQQRAKTAITPAPALADERYAKWSYQGFVDKS